jgi:hypothetical protein
MYFLVGFQGFPPFDNVTKGKPNYPLVDNDHNKMIYAFSYNPFFRDFLNQNYYTTIQESVSMSRKSLLFEH